MAYDGSGNYSLPPGSIVSDGTTIDASDLNVPVTDIAAALSQVLLRSGVAPMTGNLNMGGFSITNVGGTNPVLGGNNIWTGANTWSGTNIMTTTAIGGVPLELTSTNTDAGSGPVLSIYRNSPTPANGDANGAIVFYGKDSIGTKTPYTTVLSYVYETTNGLERSELQFYNMTSGANLARMIIGGGIYHPSATGGDKGNNTLNFGAVHQNGNVVASLAVANTWTADQTINTTGPGHYPLYAHVDNVLSVPLRTDQYAASGGGICYHTQHFVFSSFPSPGPAIAGGIRGNAGIPAVDYWNASDGRLKEQICDLDDAGEILDRIKPRRFKWKGTSVHDAGFIASEVHEVLPNVADGDEVGNATQMIAPAKFIPFLVAEIKALRARVAALEAALP
jgi:hypothetical protein